MKRIITVVLEIHDPEAAKDVWDKHMSPDALLAGCRVESIANGDIAQKYEDLLAFLPEDLQHKWESGE